MTLTAQRQYLSEKEAIMAGGTDPIEPAEWKLCTSVLRKAATDAERSYLTKRAPQPIFAFDAIVLIAVLGIVVVAICCAWAGTAPRAAEDNGTRTAPTTVGAAPEPWPSTGGGSTDARPSP